jgi:hypothetical protein
LPPLPKTLSIPFNPLDFDGISNKRPEAGVDETADDPEVSFFLRLAVT